LAAGLLPLLALLGPTTLGWRLLPLFDSAPSLGRILLAASLLSLGRLLALLLLLWLLLLWLLLALLRLLLARARCLTGGRRTALRGTRRIVTQTTLLARGKRLRRLHAVGLTDDVLCLPHRRLGAEVAAAHVLCPHLQGAWDLCRAGEHHR
jgi:hypothetical protein